MRKIMFAVLMALFVGGIAFASVNVIDNGTSNGPAQDINFVGATVTDNGPAKTVDITSINEDVEIDGALVIDGTIYTATLDVDGGIYPGRATVDPCATLGAGHIFFNNTTGAPCFCNNLCVDLSLYDGTTACF